MNGGHSVVTTVERGNVYIFKPWNNVAAGWKSTDFINGKGTVFSPMLVSLCR